jgi:hypothetical protein
MSGARPVRAGRLLLAAGVVLVGLVDAVMLAFTTGYFGGGYNSPRLSGALRWLGFGASGAVLDAFLLSLAFGVALLVGRAVRLAGLPRLAFAGGIALLLPVGTDVVTQQLHRVFGKVVGMDLLVELAGGQFSDAALNAISEAPGAALGLLAAAGGIAVLVVGARRLERRIAPRVVNAPSAGGLIAVVVTSALLGTAVLHLADTRAPVLSYGLDRKPSGMFLRSAVEAATDWDRDGFGWMARPADPAPLDPSRHPWAPETPGNGVDENGLAGDLPRAWPVPEAVAVVAQTDGASPSFLLVFLESFRGDLLGRTHAGRPVVPVLDELAGLGASSELAFAHNPFTWVSRAELFQGQLQPQAGAATLIDDFQERGYRVAYISGQDESHGPAGLVGTERADFFVDARSHADRMTSRTALTVSLQISDAVVLEEVEGYLTSTRGDPRPLFLFVNLVDTHFPYHHDELERLLDVEPVTRPEIRPWNADRVLATYLQAAANVDASVGQLVELWRTHFDAAPLLVTADHGQAFYEEGMLGHGQSVAAGQTRVPLIAVGLGGDWPEPLGLADLRGLILGGLAETGSAPRFTPDPTRRIFQFTGLLEAPKEIALRTSDGVTRLELGSGHAYSRSGAGAEKPLATDDPAVHEVIWSWEALRSAPR